MKAEVILGSAAAIMGQMRPESVDMVYADPPFGNRQTWSGKAGSFSDAWKLDVAAREGWSALAEHSAEGARLIGLLAHDDNAKGYLGVMAAILLGVRHVLKPTGTLWLHFDDTMGAELCMLCDVIFGPANSIGRVVWRRTSSHTTSKSFGRVHDTIACYGRTRVARWRLSRCARAFTVGDPITGLIVDGYADDQLNPRAAERIGYPTQKPVALLERFIREATLPGDLVLDPTCGSGTTLVAAHGLGRRAIGIDISPDAVKAATSRLEAMQPRQQNLFGEAA